MGYTTEFVGSFQLDRPLTVVHKLYLETFAETRHMKRHAADLTSAPDIVRLSVGLPVGVEGEFYVGDADNSGFGGDSPNVLDRNHPASTQPGLWCQWVPNKDGTQIQWDGNEKFYKYVEWLKYIIANFLTPWGYTLSGEVGWSGEDPDDLGKIKVVDNVVTVMKAKIVYEQVGT